MSREIKFRAWVNDHWVDWIPTCKTLGAYNASIIDADGYTFEEDNHFIVEQYTGLKDMNGKEIYEGDIVFFFTEHFDKATGGFDGEDEHNATVEWFDNGFAFIDKIPYDPNIECEVIGNIHENPELLKKGE